MVLRFGTPSGVLTAESVSGFMDDEVDVSGIIADLDEYKLGWLLMQNIVERKRYTGMDDLCLQEKLYLKYLETKFERVLIEVDFNLNELWWTTGCESKMSYLLERI